MPKFKVVIKDREYEITPFNLVRIYKAAPEGEFFISLLREWEPITGDYDPEDYLNAESFWRMPVLTNNIDWLCRKGFAKELKKRYFLRDYSYLKNSVLRDIEGVDFFGYRHVKGHYPEVEILEEGLKIPTTSQNTYLDCKIKAKGEIFYTCRRYIRKG